MPELSVVIPVYDNWWLTARCLRELDRLRGASLSFETIVVDNASSDETPEAIAAFPWVRYVRHESNRNFAGACNAGARLAEAPLTFFLNNDAYPLGDALTPMARVFDRSGVAIAGGALFFEDGVTQAAGLAMLRDAHWHYFFRNLPATLAAVDRSRDALGVSGAAMAVRTGWFVESGGFDESFVNGFEDVDLCMRAHEQGRAIEYVAQARFAHYEAASAGRFDREAQNERLFYQRWSASLVPLPRTLRGEVGAIAIRSSCEGGSLLAAARDDLEEALRGFGHPVVRGQIGTWQLLDRRFRRAASLGWFSDEISSPGVAILRNEGATTIRTRGAVALEVPWLPCASEQRAAGLKLRCSADPSCTTIGVAGDDDLCAAELAAAGYQTVRLTPEILLGPQHCELACVVHGGLTDESAFGNVLLALAGIPAVVPAKTELRALFGDDVALVCERNAIADAVARLVADPNLRARYGKLIAADARRRFSPRRSAIRVVDLLCAARFGLERLQSALP
ncbi:MAG: glycosyltransferase [Candidatus Cybelea sp.]